MTRLASALIPIKVESRNKFHNKATVFFSSKLKRFIKTDFAYKNYKQKWLGTKTKLGAIYLLGLPQERCPKEKRTVKIVSYRKRLLDYDNFIGGLKPILDSLKHVGWIYDDRPEFLELIATQEKGKEGTLVEVYIYEGETEDSKKERIKMEDSKIKKIKKELNREYKAMMLERALYDELY